ncbi:MAG: hypothetical protein JST09_21595 [Bacteroidetes bacterium]|nr:hypothetical protein [Bacteroidota bacterium]MBS1610015.1 hypothetical protein [Bacteroidota bacterium]
MPVNFKIEVTKEIIAQCIEIGAPGNSDIVGNKCPVAIAVKPIFPEVHVSNFYLFPFGMHTEHKILLSPVARNFVKLFDSLSMIPKTRSIIPAFEFTIEIPDTVLAQIDIGELFPEQELAVLNR